MSQTLSALLNKYRENSKTEREKGEYFERLIKDYLKNDPLFTSQFDEVWTYAEWAELNGLDKRDTGIDLVASLKDEDGCCAIQCKFYAEDHKIQKGDIDSFFTASGKAPFTRRLIVDTTRKPWSENAEKAMDGQTIPCTRLQLSDLENSPIDWSVYASEEKIKLAAKKTLMQHQITALAKVEDGLGVADRGKLIMACGTGKTFTSLKIAEKLVGKGGCVLYLVPSLALMSQTVREWTNDSEIQLRSFAACSDTQVGKRKANDDLSDINVHDLAYPATTKPDRLAEKFASTADDERMTVVFSTYQSIQVISDAQSQYSLPDFDLIICDEAHRTTGATLAGENESSFVRVHNQDYIKGKKRLYMTATPRIFADAVKTRADEVDAVLCSMDDTELFGETLDEVSFSYAVQNGLLTDYKVIVLAMDEGIVSEAMQRRFADGDNELLLDDFTKIIGCYRALAKLDLSEDLKFDASPMRRAVAFCRDIKSSRTIREEFAEVVKEYLEKEAPENHQMIQCEVDHVDGTFNAKDRNARLDWLSEDAGADTCRILSNARCLSEGVDVPALDAIMFLHPRKSQVDVVQSVGRVMRRAEGKNMGYVILPIGIPAGVAPDEALNNNEKYRVVWQILNALRAHDDRFDNMINRIDLGVDVSSTIEIVAVTEQLPQRQQALERGADIGGGNGGFEEGEQETITGAPTQGPQQTSFVFDDFSKAVLAKIVKKCGTRDYWEDWAGDIAKIAQTHITRITALLKEPDTEQRRAFDAFLEEIRDDLNESITESDAIEMLAQHIITRPVFDALFKDYSFAKHNPVSLAMQDVLNVLDTQNVDNENKSLEKFYDSVRSRAENLNNDEAKQKIVVQLYDKFFKKAFPRMTEKLGIVYTPVEVVDFIIHSVNDVLQSEFGESLGSEGVHILDPFTGTGTFITRLLQSGLISREQMEHKFKNEIHANEIVLLAYYIAAINIEAAYHGIMGGEYEPFTGICLTDTFQLYEKDDLISNILVDNSNRRVRQKELDIRVIMGNPPYSVGQGNANDNNANVGYQNLDERIRSTYAKYTKATNKNALYDSYIRAFRWASDRIGEKGVVGFVSGSAWVERSFADGMRKSLREEYTNLYIFHLRGDIRKNMLSKGKAREGENVFNSGSMTGIAISILVKNPDTEEQGKIYFYDIGDDLSSKDKLLQISEYNSIQTISASHGWDVIEPDKYNDWLNQRDESFDEFISIGDKKDKTEKTIFKNYSRGIASGRDAWCYNFSRDSLIANMEAMIQFYNSEVSRLSVSNHENAEEFANTDPTKISWNRSLKNDLNRKKKHTYNSDSLFQSIYRPFIKQWAYFNRQMNDMVYQMPKIFPNQGVINPAIVSAGVGARSGFSVLLVDCVTCLDMIEKGQCFPLKLYEKSDDNAGDLFSSQPSENGYQIKDGITDEALTHFQTAYPREPITKEDIFYYIYGLLHSEDYRKRYADNLSKQLPRIPCVKKPEDFWAFSKAGRELGELHVNYEEVEPYPVTFREGALELSNFTDKDYRVEKMKFSGKGKEKDKTTVIYNSKITMTNIPLEAYDYVVNGKPALEWVMERQCIKTDKASGIVNDANLYAIETVGDPAYPLKLFQRVITVSLETMKIVNALPTLDIQEPDRA